jgi:hypothetical protein
MDIKGYRQPISSSPLEDTPAEGLGLDPDRLLAAFRAMATLWAAFLVWFYVDPPGHTTFVQLTTIFMMVSAMLRIDPRTLFSPFIIGTLLGGFAYVFVMPHLSGYLQLGLMIFCATFAIYYLLWLPQQALAKTGAIVMFLNVIAVQNQQTYDFASYVNTVAMIALASGLAVAIAYLPPSPRPEKVFLRLMARFFRQSEHLISRLALDWDEKKGIVDRWKTVLYRANLLELPYKLDQWGGKIDTRMFPDNNPEQVQKLVTSLHAFALRIKELAETRDLAQADLLVRELLDDLRAWRLIVQEHLRHWADDPATAVYSSVEMRARLMRRLDKLEARLDETFRLVGEGKLGAQDHENLYRLLGSFRGLSEAGIGYAQLAEKINWRKWQEARF